MDRRNQPVEFWGQNVAFWWRIWQNQLEFSLRFWGAMAERMPHPSAADLSAEAEAMRDICDRRSQAQRPAPSRPRKQVAGQPAQRVH
jgi:hypothetical protein